MAPENNNNGNGNIIKIPWMTMATLISWIVAVVMAFAMMETKDHAEKTYIRKDVFEQFANRNRDDLQEIKSILNSIDQKIEKKEDKKAKP